MCRFLSPTPPSHTLVTPPRCSNTIRLFCFLHSQCFIFIGIVHRTATHVSLICYDILFGLEFKIAVCCFTALLLSIQSLIAPVDIPMSYHCRAFSSPQGHLSQLFLESRGLWHSWNPIPSH